ncbi:DUF488 domain-containing protein [Aestuariimicrobium kwangyangense]|uniref:DUF488 domain-containing protein n=1 Tax=Aestuariimicrobium kwangyangense TaxID=396389 RepID=UPI0003B40608|nr:DUF488 family protein [Aestuariimicrobium kwangyangense]
MKCTIARVQDAKKAGPDDGFRVLVDRLWPRGVRKHDLDHDRWAKELAPSTELRQRFGHDPDKFADFRTDYLAELQHSDEAGRVARELVGLPTVMLLYSAHDTEHNQAVVLKEWLEGLS